MEVGVTVGVAQRHPHEVRHFGVVLVRLGAVLRVRAVLAAQVAAERMRRLEQRAAVPADVDTLLVLVPLHLRQEPRHRFIQNLHVHFVVHATWCHCSGSCKNSERETRTCFFYAWLRGRV